MLEMNKNAILCARIYDKVMRPNIWYINPFETAQNFNIQSVAPLPWNTLTIIFKLRNDKNVYIGDTAEVNHFGPPVFLT